MSKEPSPALKADLIAFLIVLVVAVVCLVGLIAYSISTRRADTWEEERTDYQPPQIPPDEVFVDDRLEDKHPPAFDPGLVDRRRLDERGEWLLNASDAVLRLDAPAVLPDQEQDLLVLHASYTAACRRGGYILPSVNLLDGKAKQFDDGLYAALDQAYYQGLEDKLLSHVQLIRRMYERAGKDHPAAPYLAAGLELAGVKVEVTNQELKKKLLEDFLADAVASKPVGVYTWNPTLAECFRFLRFFMTEFRPDDPLPPALADLLAKDEALLRDYEKVVSFFRKLTNPSICLSVGDLVRSKARTASDISALVRAKNVAHARVALFPPSTSRETVLFDKLFLSGLPPDVNLMREFVRRIRSGEVDLRPTADSGWYDYQVYALETMLLPEKGEEKDKLLLTRAYKKRMLEAFQALITKRRETHVRQLGTAGSSHAGSPPKPLMEVSPRLRVEPCPSYFLRTARAYAFLINFLESAIGPDALRTLHGLRREGPRAENLHAELRFMRELFYGLYLVSTEDIGMKPGFLPDEPVDQEHCYTLATGWLGKALDDQDLAADTRVAVPVFVDGERATRLWLTLGVRLAKLEASYASRPQVKPAEGGDWRPVEEHLLKAANYLIPVDEFAEVELKGHKVLTREELRAICDREQTKEAILRALQR